MEDLSRLAKEHTLILGSYLKNAQSDPAKAMSMAYNFIKQVAKDYYHNEKMDPSFNTLINYLRHMEVECLGKKNIVKFSKMIDLSKNSFISVNILDYIVWRTRKYLMGNVGDNTVQDLYNWNFRFKCVLAADYFKQLCQNIDIKCDVLTIYPGYDPKVKLDVGIAKHCFNIVQYNGKKYLVDITLAQFFNKNENNIERLGIPKLMAPSVGCYMLLSEKGREIAYKILSDGYVELTEEVLKIYLDSFTLFFRNGLYYEQEDSSFNVQYDINDYMLFFAGEDSQTRHEKIQCLGRQKKPLNNSQIDFKNMQLK